MLALAKNTIALIGYPKHLYRLYFLDVQIKAMNVIFALTKPLLPLLVAHPFKRYSIESLRGCCYFDLDYS